MKAVAGLAIALLTGVGGCTSTPASVSNPPPDTRHNADQLMLLALRASAAKDWTRASQLATSAVAREPARADLAWLQLQLCTGSSGCDAAPLEARFRKLAPGNAAVWLGPLQRAQAQKDAQVEARVVEQMSRSAEFRLYWTTSMHRLASAALELPAQQSATPLTTALAESAGVLSSALPPFASLTKACTAETARDAARRAACARIAQLLEGSDTIIAEAVGLGVAERIAAAGSSELVDVKQRVALLNYRRQTAEPIMNAQIEREKFSAEMLQLLQASSREQDVYSAVLRWAGKPLQPQ